MKFYIYTIIILILGTIHLLDCQQQLFGFHPPTIWQHGILYDNRLEFEKRENQDILIHRTVLEYGLTTDLAPIVFIPYVVESRSKNKKKSGLGDILVGFKYHAYANRFLGGVNDAGFYAMVKLPTGKIITDTDLVEIGTGSYDFLGIVTARHATLKQYFIWSLAALLTGTHKQKKEGNLLLYSATWLYRLKQVQYDKLDFVVGFEIDGIYSSDKKECDRIVPNTSRNIVFFGPLFFLEKYNGNFKFCIQKPIAQHRAVSNFRGVIAFEFDF